MSAAMPFQIKLGMDPASTTPTEMYECMLSGLAVNEELVEAAGLRGTRGHASERVRQGKRAPKFSVTLQPNSTELGVLLPRILGGAGPALAETLPSFVCVMDLVQQRWNWTGCVVSKATFSSSAGGLLTLELEIEALDVATAGTAFPALTISTVGPFQHSDLVATVAGTGYQFKDAKLTIDNMLKTDRFFMSQTRTSLPAQDRSITWELDGPYGDNSALYGLAVGGVAVVGTWTNGGEDLVLTSPKVQFPRQPPTIDGRDEILLPLQGIARTNGGAAELTCSLL